MLIEGVPTSLRAKKVSEAGQKSIEHISYSADGWGTIAPGKAADLVLLDADPLADIANTRKIAAVVRGGKFLDRRDLDQMLAKVRAAAEATVAK